MATYHKKLIFAVFIIFGIKEASSAECQRLSVHTLKQKLLAAGGTLHPQMVAIDREGAEKFKSHLRTKSVSRVTSIASSDVDADMENDDVDVEDLFGGENHYNDDDDRMRSRQRRSTSTGTCYGPGTPVNNLYLLCHICDSTTVLSVDYFPRYVNEIICNPNKQAKCFQGQGECAANAVPTVFLKKTAQCVTNANGILMENWESVTINVRTCCECRLYPNSFLIPLTV